MTEMKPTERPKFFFPYAKDEAMAEDEWRKQRVHYGATDQRIYSLTWEHKDVIHEAEVGKPIRKWPEEAGVVIAILRARSCYLVLTAYRGILGNVPVIVGVDEYVNHAEFDAEKV